MKTNVFEAKNDLLIAFGDTHIGNCNSDLKALEKMVKFAEKSGAHLIGLGDWCECISVGDKRFDLSSVDTRFLDGNLIQNQYDYIEEVLRPVKNQILGLHAGNHCAKITKMCQIDMVYNLCRNLGVPYLENSAFTRLSFKRPNRTTSFVIYSTHGSQGGRNTGSKVNIMEKFSNGYVFSLGLMGHTHTLFTTTSTQMYLSQNNTLAYRTVHYGNTGTFLRGIQENTASYAETSNYLPNSIGYLLYKFEPETHTITGKTVIL